MDNKQAGAAVFKPKGVAPVLRQKRSDQVADEIKRWTVYQGLEPGNRLPKEKELADWFGCGRGTVREALKALEVQGFVSVRTGPNGGPILMAPGYKKAAAQLRAYLNFQKLNIDQVYQMRLLTEPAMAVAVVDVVDDELLRDLQGSAPACESEALGEGISVRRRELDFHTILAQKCPNPLLAFQSLFINNLLRDYITFDKPETDRFDAFTRDNCHFHAKLIRAYAARDRETVGRLMREHMESSRRHTMELCGKLPVSLLLNPRSETS